MFETERKKQINNFTLIEILVVIAIIAIIAGMLFPALNRAREKAREIDCAGSLKQFGISVAMYCNDNDGWLPNASGGGSNWIERIALSMGSAAGWNYGWKSGASTTVKKLFLCPAGNPEAYYGVNYSYNKRVGYYHATYGYPTVTYCAPRRIDHVKNPGSKLLMTDAKNKTYSNTCIDNNISQVDFRHGAGTNILWIDGHVSMCKYYEVNAFDKEWKPY